MKYKLNLRLIFLWIVIALFAMPLNHALASGERINIGIAVFEDRQIGLSAQDALLITNTLTNNLTGIQNVTLIERHRLEDAIRIEFLRRNEPEMDIDTMAEVGRLLGLQYIIVSSLVSLIEDMPIRREPTRLEVEYEVNVRMIYVATGAVIFSRSQTNSAEERTFRRIAIREATSELAIALRDELIIMTAPLPVLQHFGTITPPQRDTAWLNEFAERGNPAAQRLLDSMHGQGGEAAQHDAQVIELNRRAAAQGDADAQFYLGLTYSLGKEVAQNYVQAAEWFRRAAAQGNAGAQFSLGFMYHFGRGVAQNYAQAIEWYRRAAAQGDVGAQLNLGFIYHFGRGVAQNYAQAIEWFRRAAAQGDVNAIEALRRLQE